MKKTFVLLAAMLLVNSSFGQPAKGSLPDPRDRDWTVVKDFDAPTLEFSFPDMRIGVAEYAEGPTGCVVFWFPKGAQCAVDQRGGFSGTYMLGDGYVDAIVYSGGSLMGLQAATGVAEGLMQKRRSVQWYDIPVVRGAIVYDYLPRNNYVFPDATLGLEAFRNTKRGSFPLGRVGAGAHTSCGINFDVGKAEWGGQGAAFREVGDVKIAVFTIVNALGAVHGRDGKVIKGNRDRSTGETESIAEQVDRHLEEGKRLRTGSGRTTLTLVVTNKVLDHRELRSLARQVNASMGRAIQPINAFDDGDLIYAVTTNEVNDKRLGVTALGVIASELAWDAVIAAVTQEED
ncbi:MAG: P1 family peptidase [Verrucomicrobiota bacterium]